MTIAVSDIGPYAIVPKWVADALLGNPGALALFLRLALMADRTTGEAWPSRAFLANALGCSVDTVDRHKRDLETIGALTVTQRTGADGALTSNVYTVHLSPGVAAPMRPPSRTHAATPSRTGAALISNHFEQDPPIAPQGGRRRPPRQPLADTERRADFDTWYAAYPKKVGRLDAQQAWRKALTDLPHVDALLTAVNTLTARLQAEHRMAADWSRYMPYPATWLNGRRWEDETAHAVPARRAGPCVVCGSGDPLDVCAGVGKGLLAEEGDCPWRR